MINFILFSHNAQWLGLPCLVGCSGWGGVVSGGWGSKGCMKLKNMLRIKSAEFSVNLKNIMTPVRLPEILPCLPYSNYALVGAITWG